MPPPLAEAFAAAGTSPVWYHGKVDRLEAEERLKGSPDGTFILRDSSSSPNDFVLTVSENQKVSHYIIQRRGANTYVLGEQTFRDVVQLLEFYKKHILESAYLKAPIPPGTKYDSRLNPAFLFTVKALYSFQAKDPEDLSFTKGELLNVLEKPEPAWYKAQSHQTALIGQIPTNYVEVYKPDVTKAVVAPNPPKPSGPILLERGKQPLPPPPAPVQTRALPPPPPEPEVEDEPERIKFIVARAIMDRVAAAYDTSALSFKAGDVIHVLKQPANGLWVGTIVNGDGRIGHFPFLLTELIDSGQYDDDLLALKEKYEEDPDIYGTF